MENKDGIIIFLDQQQTFDRIEWGWAQACLRKKLLVNILCMD
jgi:hypothetical protein